MNVTQPNASVVPPNPRVSRLRRELAREKRKKEDVDNLNSYVAYGSLAGAATLAIPVLAAGSIATGAGVAMLIFGGVFAVGGLLYGGGHLVNKSRELASQISILESRLAKAEEVGYQYELDFPLE